MTKVRVRFAPSPTGPLHMGGVRTALFNYLFAKKNQGTFVLRIEDTDQNRLVSTAEQYIIDALEWCEIPFDEGPGKCEKYGPYRQSERKHLYKAYADELVSKGMAYYAFDSAASLDAHRKDHEAEGKTFIYNWHNREKLSNSLSLSTEEVKQKIAAGEDYVIRFKMHVGESTEKCIEGTDQVRGRVSFKTALLDDKVLFKSDGMPTYHLANVVDDHLMKISHVIRGEEWLPSLPLHLALYEAFGWEKPVFAHLPLILKPVGKGKLSKRDGDKMGFPVFPLAYTNQDTGAVSQGYREAGYFPAAFVNMLALLGWNPGTEQEMFDLDALCSVFSLERVSKSGAKFNPEKARWFNQQYLQQYSDASLAELLAPLLKEKNIHLNNSRLEKVVSLVRERATFVIDLWDLGTYFFTAPEAFDPKAVKKCWKEDSPELMRALVGLLESSEDFEVETLSKTIKAWIQGKDIGFGKVMQPLRLALVGEMKGVDLFEILAFIGKKSSLDRIEKALNSL